MWRLGRLWDDLACRVTGHQFGEFCDVSPNCAYCHRCGVSKHIDNEATRARVAELNRGAGG